MLAALGTILIGLLLSWFISAQMDDRVEAAAERRAESLVEDVVTAELARSEVAAGTTPTQAAAVLRERTGTEVLGIGVRRFDGTVLLSVGDVETRTAVHPESTLARAFEGRTVTQLVEGEAGPMAASYVPLRLSGGSLDLVAEIYQDPEAVGGIEVLRRTLIPAMMAALAAAYLLFVKLWRSAATSPNRATPRSYRGVQESDALLETRA